MEVASIGCFILVVVLTALTIGVGALTATSSPQCYRPPSISDPCIPLTSKLCLGAQLPFTHTSVTLANDSDSLQDAYDKLHLWSGLQNVPQCWAVVQPFLCSVYLPRCNDTQGVELPSKELCERTRKPCEIVHEINNGWPDFLRCDHHHFVSGCGLETYDKLTFNTTGRCEPPLVRTDDPGSWFDGVEGCGIPCNNPLYSAEQHTEVHTLIAVFGSICLVCTLFTVMTFIIDWKNANRYPALILFFINTCFFLGSIGWMSQFAGDARTDIVCRVDGTVRKGEPQLGSDESISCTVVFVMVYYFLVAGVSWFVMLAYAWYLTFTALGSSRDALVSKTAYFHLISWCLPLVLTIICLAISEVDGDSVSGICFVGGLNHGIRAVFVLVPVGLVIVISTFFLIKGVITLVKIGKEAPVFIPEKTFSKIRDTILRLGIFTAVALMFAFITFAVHVYIFANEAEWKSSFRDYLYCVANVSVSTPDIHANSVCVIKHRPSLVAMEIHIFAFFGAGIAMSSWSWTKASLSSWERFLRWLLHKPSNKPVKLRRHRMIAQAFEKRKEINQGRMSISYRSSHDDPLGMKFDLNSGSDDELSSNFAMAMPKLVRRRGGLIYPAAGIGRRYSDSDVQSVISTRRVSRELQLMEFREAQFLLLDNDGLPDDVPGKRAKKKKKKRGKLNRIRPLMGPLLSGLRFGKTRKSSDSSAISKMSAHSVRVSREKNMETVSLGPNEPLDVVLPALTKNQGKDTRRNSRMFPFSEFSPRKQGTDFSIFSNKNELSGSKGGAGVQGGLGAATHDIEMQPTLPGAPEETRSDLKTKRQAQQQQQHPCHPHRQWLQQVQGVQNAPGVPWQTPRQMPDQSTDSQQEEHQQQIPGTNSGGAVSKNLHQSRTVTVETHKVECNVFPLSNLMADISGGNWGVLLGKSGSSSGSEVGVGRASGYLTGGSAFMAAAAQAQSQPFTGNSKVPTVEPHRLMMDPMNYVGELDYYPDGSHPYMGMANPYMERTAPYMVSGDPYMGMANPYMVGATPYMGGTNPYMGGANPYMGVQVPSMATNSSYMGRPPEMLVDSSHPYTGGMGPSMGVNSLKHGGGAQPKLQGQWGHFPTYPQQSPSTQTQQPRDQGWQRKRSMRRPSQAFLSTTLNIGEDDIESIST